MRLTEPLRGFNIVGGNMVFHFTLLLGSFVSLNFGKDNVLPISKGEHKRAMETIKILRVAHII